MTLTTSSPITGLATQADTFNEMLREIHGPTPCIGSSLTPLVSFPTIPCLSDANVLDVHLSLTQHDGLSATHAKARYGTSASCSEAAAFYGDQLAGVSTAPGTSDGAFAHFDALLDSGHYQARVFELGWLRTVIVEAEHASTGPVAIEDLANWHGLAAAFADGRVTKAEVFTVAAGLSAPIQAVYSTEYLFATKSVAEVRALATEALMSFNGPVIETFENVLAFADHYEGEAMIDSTANGTSPRP